MEKHGYTLTMLLLCQMLILFNYMYLSHVNSQRVPSDSTCEINSKMDQLPSDLPAKVDQLRFDLKFLQLKLNQKSISDQINTPDTTGENVQQELESLRSQISEADKDIHKITIDLEKVVHELNLEKVQTNDRFQILTDKISSLDTNIDGLNQSFTGTCQKLDNYDEKLENYDEKLGQTGE